MYSFKLPMKKYLTLVYVLLSVMSIAQFKDNTFDQNQNEHHQSSGLNAGAKTESGQGFFNEGNQSSLNGVPGPGDHEEGPGNPGEPVPIDNYLFFLFLSSFGFIFYYQSKKRKINI